MPLVTTCLPRCQQENIAILYLPQKGGRKKEKRKEKKKKIKERERKIIKLKLAYVQYLCTFLQ